MKVSRPGAGAISVHPAAINAAPITAINPVAVLLISTAPFLLVCAFSAIMGALPRKINDLDHRLAAWQATAILIALHKATPMTLTPQLAQRFLAANFAPWVQALDLTITAIGPDGATLSMPITPDLERVGGILSGQALAAMADTAMVFACAGHLGEFRPVATTNLDTQFLRPGSGDAVTCDARIVRAGKALIFTQATMVAAPSGKPVATATATFFLP